MKGYTDFAMGWFGSEAFGGNRNDPMKYMDWDKVREIIKDNPNSTIEAGLREDWNNTSGLIYEDGEYYNGGVLYNQSCWATPIVDVDGEEIECWTYEKKLGFTGVPADWCA